jgi:hypothetical protein
MFKFDGEAPIIRPSNVLETRSLSSLSFNKSRFTNHCTTQFPLSYNAGVLLRATALNFYILFYVSHLNVKEANNHFNVFHVLKFNI